MPEAFQLSREPDEASFQVLKDPKALIEDILDGQNNDSAIQRLVQRLSLPGYSIMDLLADAGRLKVEIAGKTTETEAVLNRWTALDRVIAECIALTSSSQEEFVDRTLHAFCRYDSDGTIFSANSKMLALDPDCIGKSLARYFGTMDKEVERALKDHPRRLYELELETRASQLPVLAEFGPTETGGYALLVDMSDRVGAEHKALESAPYGMLKLDANHRIIYATEKVAELLELGRDELIGVDPRRFLADEESRNTVIKQGIERRSGIGGTFDVRIITAKTRKVIRLKIASIPNFDSAGLFCGSILQIQRLDVAGARLEIAELVGTITDHEKLYEQIVEIVREFIDFDWANLFVYSPKRDYSRIVCTRGPKIAFVSRWFPTPDGYLDWLGQEKTWMTDLGEVMAETAPEQLRRTDTKAAIEAGMRALVCLPIRSGGNIIGGLCLASKQKGIYDKASREILKRLNLEQALLALLGMIEGTEREFVNGLVRGIVSAQDMQDVAKKVVDELARFYEYRNVSIFKVNVVRGYIQLLAQAIGPGGGKPMPTGYSQAISKGLLGLCYQRGDFVILKDIDDGSKEAQAYITVTEEIRSELCIPIRLFGRVLWILNLEDCFSGAFTLIEVKKLEHVIEQVQASLERIFQNLILVKVLDVCPAAVVITDQEHNILRCNRRARQMMQQDSASQVDNLRDFFEVAPSSFAANPTPAIFLSAKGKGTKVEVLASRVTLEEEYDQVVFMLQNVAELEWTAKFETLRAALAETTAQVRVPVSLLSSFVRRIGQQTKDDYIRDIITKAIRQIGRIELTYDRVLASYEAQTLLTKRDALIDVGSTVDQILFDLPDMERKSVRRSGKLTSAAATVMADPYRLFFTLNSMIAYLLRSRTGTDPIVISIFRRGDAVGVSMTGAVQKTPRVRHLAAMVEATRTEIALGREVLARFAQESGGDFALLRQKNGRERLSLKLPASNLKFPRSDLTEGAAT